MAVPKTFLRGSALPSLESFASKSVASLGGGLSAADRELVPYVKREAEEEARKRGLLKPLEVLFDILSRGQYLTANIAKQITENVRAGKPFLNKVPRAVANAVSGKVKGDWTTVLFGGTTPGEEGEFEGIFDWDTEKGTAANFFKNAMGFAANVAFDPSTYLSAGSAAGAKTAASRYGDDAVRGLFRAISKNPEKILPELIQSGFQKKTFNNLWQKSEAEAIEYLRKHAGQNLPRLMNKTKKTAERLALRTPASKLTADLRDSMLDDILEEAGVKGTAQAATIKAAREAAEKQPDFTTMFEPKHLPKQLEGETATDFTQKLLEYFGGEGPYGGAGKRAHRFMRKEFNVRESNPKWLQAMDKLKGRFEKSRIGGMFSDAWWATMNNPKSPVARLRKQLHIRNPYQKMLSILEHDAQERAFHSLLVDGEEISRIVKSLSDEEKKAVTGAMIWSQIMQEARGGKGVFKEAGVQFPRPSKSFLQGVNESVITMSAEEIAQKFTPEGVDVEKVTNAIREANELTGEWIKFNKESMAAWDDTIGEWEDYLPIQSDVQTAWKRPGKQMTGPRSAFARERELGMAGHVARDKKKLMWQFGVDEERAADLLAGGVGDMNVDLQSMLTRRAFAQSRFKQRVHILESFKEFGIDVEAMKTSNPEMYEALAGKWGDLGTLGLSPVEDKALEGFVFDPEVAEVFNRALDITKSNTAWKTVIDAANNFTSWWRGWATLSPGFHARNHFSNWTTLFLKHGMEAFDPDTYTDALIGTFVGLHGKEEGVRLLSKIIPKQKVLERLVKRMGNLTLEQLAEYTGTRGVVTKITRGFYQPQDYKDLMKIEGKMFEGINMNPFSRKFTPMNMNRELGSYIESSSRMHSFLLDYKRSVRQGANSGTAAEYAKMEAKKWFIDYGDLTKTEQHVLKNIIPFYSWIRGNIANQISGLAIMPEMYGVMAKGTSAITSGGVDREEIPDWARDLGMIPVGPTETDKQRFFWPNFPYQDINKLPIQFERTESGFSIPQSNIPNFINELAEDAHPIIKTFVEVTTGQDVFYQNEFGETEKAPRALRILTKAPVILKVLDGAMRRAGFPEGLRAGTDERGRLVIDGKIGKVLENNVLMLKRMPQFFDAVEIAFPAIEEWKAKVFGAVDDHEGLEELFQTMSFYMGIKFKDIDIDEASFHRKQKILADARKQRSEDSKSAPGHARRSLEWRRQQEAVQRKFRL